MADKENAAKPAPQVRSPAELPALYDRLHELEWNAEKDAEGKIVKPGTAYKNPTMVIRSLLNFGRIGSKWIAEAWTRIGGVESKITALEAARSAIEARLAAQESKIAALEAARASDEEQQGVAIEAAIAQIADLPPEEATAARAQLAELMSGPGVPAAIKGKIQAALAPPPAPAAPPAQDAAVVPIKPPKKPAKADGGGSGQGGAA